MTSHSGSKEEGIFFSFQTTKPRKKKTQAKTSEKQKKKKEPKNQAVTPSYLKWRVHRLPRPRAGANVSQPRAKAALPAMETSTATEEALL